MRLTICIGFLLGLLVFLPGCSAESRIKGHSTGRVDQADQRPVHYPTGRALKFPEEQVIKEALLVTTQWRTITFRKPLEINRQGLMGLHLAVNKEPYISTMDTHPLNPDCNKPGCEINAFCLRRLSDGALIRPEVILVGDDGTPVKIRPAGHLYPSFDKHIMTMALRTFKDVNSPAPDFPEGIKAFTSMKIRSTEPFRVRYLWWSVDRHPDIFNR